MATKSSSKSTTTTTTPKQVIGTSGGTQFFVGGTSTAAPKTTAAAKTTTAAPTARTSTAATTAPKTAATTLKYETGSLAGDLAKAAQLTAQQSSAAPVVAAPVPAPVPAAVIPETAMQQQIPQKVEVTAPSVIKATDLTGAQVTAGNVPALVNEVNRQYIQMQKQMAPTRQETQAISRQNELNQQLRQLQTQQLASETALRDQPAEILQAIVGRQINALNRFIAAKQLPVVNELQAQTDLISQYQNQRAQTLKQLEVGLDLGKFNLSLARDYETQKLNEQKALKDLFTKAGVTSRYVEQNGTVYDATTGEGLPLAEFQKRTGQTVGLPESQTNFSMVQPYQNALAKVATSDIVSKLATEYWDSGVQPSDSLAVARQKIQQNSRIYQKQVKDSSGGGGTSLSGFVTDNQMRDILYKIKQAYPKENNMVLWQQAADYIQSKGYNPTYYDKLFKEVFDPNYQRPGGSSSDNPF